ncbi:MAG: DUF3352 domain-containing protein [Prochlorotrichaceae cyanobacterium]|jgi:hypothetical protein
MSKVRNGLIAIGAIALLGGGGAYWYFKIFRGPATQSRLLGAAALVPDQALMATFVSTDPSQWEAVDRMGSPVARDLLKARVADLQSEILQGTELSYETDLQPWVDGVMVSVLPPTEVSPDPTEETNVLMIMGIKDKLRALDFANKMRSQSGVTIETLDYQGIEVSKLTQGGDDSYSAVLGDYVVFSPQQRSVEWAIDTAKGGSSLRDQPGTDKALQSSLNLDNSVMQLYIPDYGGFVNQILAQNEGAAPISPGLQGQLSALDNVVAGLSLEDNGLRLRALVTLDEQPTLFSYRTAPGQVLNFLPGETLALLSGQDPQSLWQNLVAESQNNPQVGVVVEGVQRQLAQLNLDLEQDVLSWMTGEFVVAALANPPDQGILGSLGVAGAIVLDSSNPTQTNETLGKLDTLVAGNLTVEKTEVEGKALTYWRLPQGIFNNQTFLGYGWLTPQTLFVALGDAAIESLVEPATPRLVDAPDFQTVTDTLPKNNGGYFYFKVADVATSANLAPIGGQFQRLPQETQALVQSVQSVAITTSQPDQNLNQVDMFLQFSPSAPEEPQPTP